MTEGSGTKETAKKKLVIFTDIGDTVIDEGSEVRTVPNGVVHRAACIPGAKETLLELYGRGYVIAMVADGLVESFRNTMGQNGLAHVFSARAISEALGVEKPSPVMFQAAMDGLGLTDADKPRVIMVGNNIKRDVAGANRFGLRSVLLDWSPRYDYEPACADEVPDHVIHAPEELIGLVEKLNEALG